jgi:hypothetical protein
MRWIRTELDHSNSSPNCSFILGGDLNACTEPWKDRPSRTQSDPFGLPLPQDIDLIKRLNLPDDNTPRDTQHKPSGRPIPGPRDPSHVFDGRSKRTARIDDFIYNEQLHQQVISCPNTRLTASEVLNDIDHHSDHSPILATINLSHLNTSHPPLSYSSPPLRSDPSVKIYLRPFSISQNEAAHKHILQDTSLKWLALDSHLSSLSDPTQSTGTSCTQHPHDNDSLEFICSQLDELLLCSQSAADKAFPHHFIDPNKPKHCGFGLSRAQNKLLKNSKLTITALSGCLHKIRLTNTSPPPPGRA